MRLLEVIIAQWHGWIEALEDNRRQTSHVAIHKVDCIHVYSLVCIPFTANALRRHQHALQCSSTWPTPGGLSGTPEGDFSTFPTSFIVI